MKINMTPLVFGLIIMFGSLSYDYPQQFKNSQKSEISSINIDEVEPNDSPAQAQLVFLDQFPTEVNGNAEANDVGTQIYSSDDIEDLFKITISGGDLYIYLDGINLDCDLYLLDEAGSNIVQSRTTGNTQPEELDLNLPSGTYLVGVSIDDNIFTSGETTPYVLQLYGESILIEATINLNLSVNFGDPTRSSSYRMIGLPGNNDLALSSVFSGEAWKDWIAYHDNGSLGEDFLEEYNTTQTFRFRPGNGFWILAQNGMNINMEVDNVVPDENGLYWISLHSGWNIISNPFNYSIDWELVKSINLIGEDIYDFTGSYSSSSTFQEYKGYYFYNVHDRSSLAIPLVVPGNGDIPLLKTTDQDSNKIKLSLFNNDIHLSEIEVGINEDAKASHDKYDKFAPPGYFEDFKISLYEEELESQYKHLKTEYVPAINDGRIFELNVKTIPNERINIIAEGLERFSQYEIYLLNERNSNLYNLREDNSLDLTFQHKENNFQLIIGTDEFIKEFKVDLIPSEYVLYQNYPNPFNPSTKIKYNIPLNAKRKTKDDVEMLHPAGAGQVATSLQTINVELRIYDILGREVTVLVNEKQKPGIYEVGFNAQGLTSGLYFYRIEAGEYVRTRKMVLLK